MLCFQPFRPLVNCYLSVTIANDILMYLRQVKKYQNDMSLQEPVGTDKEGNEVTMEDKLQDDSRSVHDEVELKVQKKTLHEKILKTLKGREKTVIEMRYGLFDGEEITQREIAETLDISRSYVSRIEKKALEKLLREMQM